MKKRVLIVDDSAFMRQMISEILSESSEFDVVGVARNGRQGVDMTLELQPDVVTMDIEMPVMSGLEALREIMQKRPTPVVMLSSVTQAGADVTMQCLSEGAVDCVGKPSGTISLDIKRIASDIRLKVGAAVRVRLRTASPVPSVMPVAKATEPPKLTAFAGNRPKVAIIGSSTGGPKSLQTLVPQLPANFPIPIVIVQHMPPHFTKSLAERLDQISPIKVKEAEDGDRLLAGSVLIAQGGKHLIVNQDQTVVHNEDPLVHGVRPAIDVTMESLIARFDGSILATILTGMGKDGAAGCREVRKRGGRTIAEDESTCAVFGMPRAVIELGAAEFVLPLPEIAGAMAAICMKPAAIAA